MNSTISIAGPVQATQFLSVFNYLSTMSNLFYSKNLIQENQQFQRIPVVNAYFKYLEESNDEMQAKTNLVHRLLQGSELYGGNENETLDNEYVNETFELIVSDVIFSRYGNIYGYLAKIVSSTRNLTLSSLKRRILNNLSRLTYLNENMSISKLSLLASKKIAETLIWPLFPQPEKDMEIIDVDYIYAQAGLMLARSTGMNLTNFTFDQYITMSLSIEFTALKKEIDESVLQIFTLPAVLYYAHEKKNELKNHKMTELIYDHAFMSEAFHLLFSHLNKTFETINEEAVKSSPYYQFHLAMSEFKSRTLIAEEILRKDCPPEKESDYESAIKDYKLYASSTRCPQNGNKLLPNVDNIFSNETDKIKEKYRSLMKLFIEEAFHNTHLFNLINSTDTTVMKSFIAPLVFFCGPIMCAAHKPYSDPNILLFAMRHDGKDSFHVMVQRKDHIFVVSEEEDPEKFRKKSGMSEDDQLKVVQVDYLKNSTENFDTFVDRVANIKAEEFGKQLHEWGYEKTFGEKMVDFLLTFVPFYHCITYAKAGDAFQATMSCMGDVISFIPFAGRAVNLGYKLSSIAMQRLLTTGVSMQTFTFRQFIRHALSVGYKESIRGASEVIDKVILTKQTLKNLSVDIIRSVDPGFELAGRLLYVGGGQIRKLLKSISTRTTSKISSYGLNSGKLEKIWASLIKNMGRSTDDVGMIPEVVGHMNGYEVFIKTYPRGVYPYGPKYVRLPEGNAELRRMIGVKAEIPVVVCEITKWGKVYYKQIDLSTLKPLGPKLKLNENGLLELAPTPFRQHIHKIVTEGLSGRGKLLEEKKECIESAAELVSNSELGIGKDEAKTIMRHYFLLTKRDPVSSDNLMDFDLDSALETQLDAENPEVIKEFIGEVPISVDPTLNQYLIMPTYHDFAHDWIRSGRIDHVYRKWYMKNPVQFEELLYEEYVEDITAVNVEEATKKINELYGKEFLERSDILLPEVMEEYELFNSHKYLRFEEYVALRNLVMNGYSEEPRVRHAKINSLIALLKLAVRQADSDWTKSSRILYRAELVDQEVLESIKRTVSFKTRHFMFTCKREEAAYRYFGSENDFLSFTNRIPVIYEFHSNSPYFAVNFYDVAPLQEQSILILPNVKFYIQEVTQKQVFGHNVMVVKLYNEPVRREIWLLEIIQKIERLQFMYSINKK